MNNPTKDPRPLKYAELLQQALELSPNIPGMLGMNSNERRQLRNYLEMLKRQVNAL